MRFHTKEVLEISIISDIEYQHFSEILRLYKKKRGRQPFYGPPPSPVGRCYISSVYMKGIYSSSITSMSLRAPSFDASFLGSTLRLGSAYSFSTATIVLNRVCCKVRCIVVHDLANLSGLQPKSLIASSRAIAALYSRDCCRLSIFR